MEKASPQLKAKAAENPPPKSQKQKKQEKKNLA